MYRRVIKVSVILKKPTLVHSTNIQSNKLIFKNLKNEYELMFKNVITDMSVRVLELKCQIQGL